MGIEQIPGGRFVVLWHEVPRESDRMSHWDVMFETSATGPLETWELLDEPHAGLTTQARRLLDHRREYLEYEGPVSRNRGWVTRWDEGTYTRVKTGPKLRLLLLAGTRLHGLLEIEPASGDELRATFRFDAARPTAWPE